jgi:excisionase family DNA binding protein
LLHCHSETLRRAIRDGFLQAARLGRGYRLSRSDLQTFWTAQGGGQLFTPVAPEQKGEPGEAEHEPREDAGNAAAAPAPPEKKQKRETPASASKQLSLIAPQGREQ